MSSSPKTGIFAIVPAFSVSLELLLVLLLVLVLLVLVPALILVLVGVPAGGLEGVLARVPLFFLFFFFFLANTVSTLSSGWI